MQEKRLVALIANVLLIPEDRITREADLIDDLGADSLSLAQIASRIEEEVGGSLPADRLQELFTVGDIMNAIESGVD